MKHHSANQTNRLAIPTCSISGHFIAGEQAPAREYQAFVSAIIPGIAAYRKHESAI
jgi:hypothetical protein